MHKVAVIGGDGIGPEVIAEALKVVAAAASSSRPSTTTSVPGATSARARSCPTRSSTSSETADAILLGAVGPPIGSTAVPSGGDRARAAAEAAFRAGPVHQPAPVQRVPGSIAAGRRSRRRPREHRGPLRRARAGALRRGTPFEVATQGSVNTRHGVERCVRYAFELAEHRRPSSRDSRAQDQRAHLLGRPLAAAPSTSVAAEHPGVAHRLQPRRRRLHLPRRARRPLRRRRHRQPLRRHPHRPRRRRHGRHRVSPRRPTSTRRARGRRFSSRCTAPRTTSPGRARRTRSPPSARRR